jgi:hypothetical protein
MASNLTSVSVVQTMEMTGGDRLFGREMWVGRLFFEDCGREELGRGKMKLG